MYPNYLAQQEELKALKVIYPKNAIEDIPSPWKVPYAPPHFKIVFYISGQHSLVLKLNKEYPKSVPGLSFQSNLPEEHQKTLLEEMKKLAAECLGCEMVYDLAECFKEHISQCVAKKVNFESKALLETSKSPVQEPVPKKRSNKIKLEEPFQLEDGTFIKEILISESAAVKERGIYRGSYHQFGFCLHVFNFLNPFYQTVDGQNEIAKVMNEIRNLMTIDHPNLVKIYSVHLQADKDVQLLVVTKEYKCHNVSDLLNECGVISISFAVEYCKQLLATLAHIHKIGIFHGALSCDDILLHKGTVRVFGTLYVRLIEQLSDRYPIRSPPEGQDKHWSAPSGLSLNEKDIWILGTVFLQMIFGHSVLKTHQNLDSMSELINKLPKVCQEFVVEILTKTKTASDLLAHPIFNSQLIEHSNFDTHVVKREALKPKNSRFYSDFEQLDFLGKGGFGEVIKVRNKLDNRLYAIKKIRIRKKNIQTLKKLLREVTTLSMLHHDHVIRYYQAWQESEDNDQDNHSELFDYDSESEDIFEADSSLRASTSSLPQRSKFFRTNRSETLDTSDDAESAFEWEEKDEKDNPITYHTEFESSDTECTQIQSNQFLYIQMEYCPNRTLRDVIDDRLSETESWKLFSQVLDALVYIHSQGLIHRDLKPSNIFLDSSGNAKIGDFGLATSGQGLSPYRQSDMSQDLTSGLGTPFYMSPEQLKPGSRYNQKVDMYSLGIIFFEMSFPFATGMERANVLQEFDKKYPNRTKIIMNLLDHDQRNRFSAVELWHSSLIPPTVEDSSIKEAIKLATSSSKYYPQLVTAVFARQENFENTNTFNWSTWQSSTKDLVAPSQIKARLEAIFRGHNAIQIELAPYIAFNPRSDAVKFIDSSGNTVELAKDLTKPFVRHLVQSGITNVKRFCFQDVFLQGIQVPKSFWHSSFDIVHASDQKFFPEIEIFKVCSQVFDDLKVKFSLIVNHSRILHKILKFCGISVQEFNLFQEVYSKPWAKVRYQLSTDFRVKAKSLDKLSTFVGVRGSIKSVKADLQSLLKVELPEFQEIEAILSHCNEIGLDFEVTCQPFLSYNLEYYDGIMFQCIRQSKSDILAFGGRYDELIRVQKPKNSFKGIGVTFLLSKLLAKALPLRPMVHIISSASTTEKLQLVNEMWDHNITCSLAFNETDFVKNNGAEFVVVLGRNKIRLKNVEKGTDTEVSRKELFEILISHKNKK